jgi:hypothetical protein
MSEQHTLIALYADDLLIACPYKQMNYDFEGAIFGEFIMKIIGYVWMSDSVLRFILETCPIYNILTI